MGVGFTAGALRRIADQLDAIPIPARRNVHCSNCGDTRGGPVGHETSECTWSSKP